MTYEWRGRHFRHAVTSTAILATIATAAAFIAPAAPSAVAGGTTTTVSSTTTTAVPGSNCSAVLNGSALGRSSWVASSNASTSAYPAANALDGNYSTRFSTGEVQAPGLYFEVNMGSAQTFNELKMTEPNSPSDYARGFDVQVSKDGTTWTTLASCTGSGTPETVSFPDQTAQYVKVDLTAADSLHWWSIDEFDLYATPTPPTTTTTTTVPPTTTTTAVPGSNCSAVLNGEVLDRTGWVASTNAPSKGADVPANAVDGNFSTRFSTQEPQATGLYFEVSMGSAQSFNELRMSVPNSANDYARGFDVQVSNDGSSWTTVANCTGTRTPEVVGFSNQTARYVRIVLTTAATGHEWWSIDEFDLLGTPPPPTTTTTTVPPTTTTTVPPFKFRGDRCRSFWPRSLTPGTLILTGHRYLVVVRPCLVQPIMGVKVLVAYVIYQRGHQHVQLRWSPKFRLGEPMHGHLVELLIGERDWVKWNGHIDRARYLGLIG